MKAFHVQRMSAEAWRVWVGQIGQCPGTPGLTVAGVCSSGLMSGSLLPPQVYELPFLVALDHKKECVVVAVRGTMSLQVRSPMLSLGTGGPNQQGAEAWRALCQN